MTVSVLGSQATFAKTRLLGSHATFAKTRLQDRSIETWTSTHGKRKMKTIETSAQVLQRCEQADPPANSSFPAPTCVPGSEEGEDTRSQTRQQKRGSTAALHSFASDDEESTVFSIAVLSLFW